MLKIGKKVVSVILVLCLMCSVFSVSTFAASDNSVGNQGVQTGIGDDMNVKSTNSFGSLLTSELEQEADKQEENNGINIFSVEVTGKTATAEFETLQDSTLVVAIYDESGVEMLASGRTAVTKEDTTAEVTIDIETMPKYFYLKAFLVDEEVYRPLCTAYESPNYTQEMQEFFAKTTDDFESDKVLNLDNDDSNNFAVYDDETKIIEPNGSKNQVASIDDDSKKYVIKNADSSITSLKSGDIFSYNYGDDEILIVKVKSISVNGTTATIYGDEASMDEVFDYVKIDEISDLSSAEVDPSTCDEGVTYKGMNEEEVNPKSSSPVGAEFEGSAGTELDFDLCSYSSNNEDDTGYPQIDFKGSLKLGLEAQVKLYITLSQQYIELSLDYSASVDFSITEKFPIKNIQLAKIVIPIVPGLDIDVIPSFVIEAEVELDLVGTLSGSVGIRANGNGEIENISKSPTFKTELKIQGTLFVGISMKPQLEIIWGLASAGLEASVGAEIEANMSILDSDRYMTTESVLHDCEHCLDGKIYGKILLSAGVEFLYSDDLEISFNMLEFKRKICDFYYSFDHNSFGFTTCPYYKYKVTVTVKDISGNVVEGAAVDKVYTTNAYGKTEFYLNGGNYTITAERGNLTGSKSFSVNNKAINVTITLKKKISGDELNDGAMSKVESVSLGSFHSAAITEDGDLYMWGDNWYGQLGDGTTTDRYIPTKIMSNVKSVILGWNHSAAITENGDLYMWGDNSYGQLGDGTTTDRYIPTKIMSNVKSVSLGENYSAAITENGDLYTWGCNACGILGNGTNSYYDDEGNYYDNNSSTPIKIMSNVKAVSLGYDHSAAITKNGDLYMWGDNSDRQLGDGTTADKYTPIKIMSNAKSVSLGKDHSAAITENGDLYMWGNNGSGQLGDGTTANKYTPIKIMSNAKSVSLRYWNSAAITENGNLYMWGYNSYGQLGNGTKGYDTNSSIPINIMSNVKSVSLGASHSAAITEDGDLHMWGQNYCGQLGDVTYSDISIPIKITIPSASVISKSSEPVSAGSDYKTEIFTDLLPNEVYNFYSMKTQNAENPFGSVNLLYITQATTDKNGNLSITYKPDESYDKAVNFVVPLKQTDLSTAAVTMKGLIYNGKEQYVTPVVTLNGKTLVEGEDYDLSGDYFAKDAGSYTVTINGRGLYTGKVDFNYSVVSSGKLGDVDNNGTVNIDDVTLIQKYLASMVELDSTQLKAADVTGDGDVSIDDVTKIQKFIAGLVSSLSNV